MRDDEKETSLTLDKKTVDVLVAQIIPTSKYFEVRFDHMQGQINDLKENLKDFRGDVDKRFEQVDKRFEQVIASIERLGDKLDYWDERQRSFTPRMLTIAIGISILGAFLKSMGII